MYCRACGSDIGNAMKCSNCGYNANKDASLNPQVKEDKILVTAEEAKKFEFLKLGLYALVLILGLSLLFLPIYKANEPESLEELVILAITAGEKENADFSYYDETVMVCKQLFNEYSTISLHTVSTSSMWLFVILLVLFVTSIVQGLCGIIRSIKAIGDPEKTRVAYSLHMDAFPKGEVMDAPLLLNVWLAAIGLVWDYLNPFGGKIVYRSFGGGSLFDFSNCLTGFWVIVILFVGIFALQIYIGIVDRDAQKTIAARRKQRRERNKEENKKAHQKYLDRQKEKEARNGAQADYSSGSENTVFKKEEKANDFADDVFAQEKNDNAKDINSVSADTLENLNKLEKYKSLLDSGVITQEEFDAKKKQLLNL